MARRGQHDCDRETLDSAEALSVAEFSVVLESCVDSAGRIVGKPMHPDASSTLLRSEPDGPFECAFGQKRTFAIDGCSHRMRIAGKDLIAQTTCSL
jgi:hypothetical protein